MQPSSPNTEKLFLIDGSGFIFRAYHALPPLSRSDGTPVGAVFGFTTMLLKLLSSMEAHYLVVVFDAGRESFRHKIYPRYKANRLETPPDLIPQFSLIRKACSVFGIPIIERNNFEADDIIASYVELERHRNIIIVSSDKDLMQLVTKRVQMFDPLNNKLVTHQDVQEKFGVAPEHVVDVQSLAGDSTDNIPGVPGIGVKTAALLIQEFKTLENLFANTHNIPQKKRRHLLETFKEQAFLSRKLVHLRRDLQDLIPVEDLVVRSPKPTDIRAFLEEQGFKSLIKRLDPTETSKDTTLSSYELVLEKSQLVLWVDRIYKTGIVAVDTETNSLNAKHADLIGISLAVGPEEACYIPLRFNPDESLLEREHRPSLINLEEAIKILRPILESPNIVKVGHNLKYDKLVLKKYVLFLSRYEDTMLLSYLQKPGRHGLDHLTELYFNHTMVSFKEVTRLGKKQLTFDQVPLSKARDYAASDADYTCRLYEILKSKLKDPSLITLYNSIDLPLVDVLVDMEDIGIMVNPPILKQLNIELGNQIQILEKTIHTLTGQFFNIASPKQLGDILFGVLGLPSGQKGKMGAYATGSDILEALKDQHPAIENILRWRRLSKLRSTYTDTLLSQINPETGRVHTSYAMAVTSTGRLSSSDPNLQNIPVRTQEGLKIRQAFIAPHGALLVSFDYSQIELRLLAHMANISTLQEAFRLGQDIHALTASQIFNIPLSDVSSDLRHKAKTINFGIVYGMSPYGLSKQLRISPPEAAIYIQSYHQQYPGIKHYMERVINDARTHGYVETLWGRRCYISEAHAKNATRRQLAERQAVNAPIQGSNADLIKKAMIEVHEFLKKGYRSRLLLQVHDELLFEIPEEEYATLIQPIRTTMESVASLKVPLLVDVKYGKTWGDLERDLTRSS